MPPYVLDFGTPGPGEALDQLWLLRHASSSISEPSKVSNIVRAGEVVCQKDNPAPDDNGSETCAR